MKNENFFVQGALIEADSEKEAWEIFQRKAESLSAGENG